MKSEIIPSTKFYDLSSNEYETNFHKKLYHYTSAKNMMEIKNSSKFKANCITHYKSKYKECLQYNNEQESLVFIISCTYKKYNKNQVKKFNKSASFITLNFLDDMYSIFDYTKPVITNTGDKLMWLNKEYSDYLLDDNLKKNIGVDVKCIDPEYCSTKKLNESSGEKTNIINYRTKLRLNEKWQNETRYVFYILSTENVKIPKYEYLSIPIKVKNLDFNN